MEFKTVEELIQTKKRLNYTKKAYENALKDAKQSKKECDYHSKSYWTQVIANYKKMVIEYNEKIKEFEFYINSLNSFPREIFIPFILECINMNEQEKYVQRNIILSETNHMTSEFLPMYTPYNIIFPESILEDETKIEKTFYVSVLKAAYLELFKKSESKHVIVPSKAYHQLISTDLKMFITYKDFPYLEDIAINLIERKLKEPDKTNVDILNEELEEQKENQKKKTKN